MTMRGCINWLARRAGFVRVAEYRKLLRDYQSLIASAHEQWLAFEAHKEEFERYRYKVDINSFAEGMRASRTMGKARAINEELGRIIHIKDYRKQ